MQKVVAYKVSYIDDLNDNYLNKGWKVIHCIAQSVSNSPDKYSSKMDGEIVFVIEKKDEESNQV